MPPDVPEPADLVGVARRLADEVLFPAAAAVDRAERVPDAHLDALARAGLYGAAAPVAVGGAGLALAGLGLVAEALAGGCLATAFVWVQHQGLVGALADSAADLRTDWLGPLAAGERRAGLALAGLLPGPPRLRATPTPDGWTLDGTAPWVTGWGLVDALLVAARAGDEVVRLLVPADLPGLRAERQRLVAAHASRTVQLSFDGVAVPADQVLGIRPYEPPTTTGAGLRLNGSLALGVTARCLRLIGSAPTLAAELIAVRQQLDDSVTDPDPDAGPAARAAASELAVRAAAALAVATGSGAALAGSDADRLTREALFLLVFGSRPGIRTGLLDRLGGLP